MPDKFERVILPDTVETGDWSIGELYSKAWELTKKHKVLWIFGIAVATFSGGGFNNLSNLSDLGSSGSSSPTPTPIPQTSFVPDSSSQILGTQTANSAADSIFSSLPYFDLFSLVPGYIWIILVAEIVLLSIFYGIYMLIAASWANGSLLSAIETAIKGEKPTISQASENAMPRIKSLIWLSIIPTLVFTVISLVTVLIVASPFFFDNVVFKVLGGILLFIWFFIWLYFMLRLTIAGIWAQRKVIVEKLKAKEAFWTGYRIAGRKFWSSLLLGAVNNILTWIIIGVPVIVLILLTIGIAAFVFDESKMSTDLFVQSIPLFSIIFVIVALVVIFGLILVNGVLTAFKAIVWSLAYHKIKGKYDAK